MTPEETAQAASTDPAPTEETLDLQDDPEDEPDGPRQWRMQTAAAAAAVATALEGAPGASGAFPVVSFGRGDVASASSSTTSWSSTSPR